MHLRTFLKSLFALPGLASLAALREAKSAPTPRGTPIFINCPPVVFSLAPSKPLLGIPFGSKARLRFRQDDFARVFIKHGDTLSEHLILDYGDHYKVGYEVNRNTRIGTGHVYLLAAESSILIDDSFETETLSRENICRLPSAPPRLRG